jgi:hypothetical protein
MQKVGYGKRKLQVVDYTQSVNGVMQVQCNAAEFEPLLKKSLRRHDYAYKYP